MNRPNANVVVGVDDVADALRTAALALPSNDEDVFSFLASRVRAYLPINMHAATITGVAWECPHAISRNPGPHAGLPHHFALGPDVEFGVCLCGFQLKASNVDVNDITTKKNRMRVVPRVINFRERD